MNNQALICNPFGKNAEIARMCHELITKILLKTEIIVPIFSF